jgi:cytochrome c biogenesis protein CcdA
LLVGLIILGLAGFTVYGIWAYGELFNNLDRTEKIAYAGVVPNVPITDFFFEILAKMNHVVMVFLFNQQFHFALFAIILTAGLTPYGISTSIFLTGQLHQEGVSNAFLLGMPFGVITPPCTAPIIVTILGLVASNGNLLFGLLTLLIFAIGRSIPLIAATTYSEVLFRYLKPKHKWYSVINKTFGGIIILGSIYFLTWGQTYFGG